MVKELLDSGSRKQPSMDPYHNHQSDRPFIHLHPPSPLDRPEKITMAPCVGSSLAFVQRMNLVAHFDLCHGEMQGTVGVGKALGP